MKVRRTRKALEYIEEWDQRPAVPTEPHNVVTDTNVFAELSTPQKRTSRKKRLPRPGKLAATRTKRKKVKKKKKEA